MAASAFSAADAADGLEGVPYPSAIRGASGRDPDDLWERLLTVERSNFGGVESNTTVLVDGDDHNEPIADAVRGILDGHIVMQRAIAERGRYPAVNILKSVSRTMPRAADPNFLPFITKARQVMATYADMEELIRLGAYRPGSSPEVDEAIRLHEPLESFLRQAKDEATSLGDGYRQLAQILSGLETER